MMMAFKESLVSWGSLIGDDVPDVVFQDITFNRARKSQYFRLSAMAVVNESFVLWGGSLDYDFPDGVTLKINICRARKFQ